MSRRALRWSLLSLGVSILLAACSQEPGRGGPPDGSPPRPLTAAKPPESPAPAASPAGPPPSTSSEPRPEADPPRADWGPSAGKEFVPTEAREKKGPKALPQETKRPVVGAISPPPAPARATGPAQSPMSGTAARAMSPKGSEPLPKEPEVPGAPMPPSEIPSPSATGPGQEPPVARTPSPGLDATGQPPAPAEVRPPDGLGTISRLLANLAVARLDIGIFSPQDVGKEVPNSWEVRELVGKAKVALERVGDRVAIRLKSTRSSFGVHRSLEFDIREYPYLQWAWRVDQIPPKGDGRRSETDDQAAQLYVVFPRFPAMLRSQIIGYVWDSAAPKGTVFDSPSSSLVKIVVLESGPEKLGRWVLESRNVLEDYRTLYGGNPPKVGRVYLSINSQHTDASAESWFADIVFTKAPLRQEVGSLPLAWGGGS